MDKRRLIKRYGKLYSEELGINLRSRKNKEIFKWFLASVLFGAPIGEKNAERTHRLFMRSRIDSPEAILKMGWDGLVKILDNGGYTRYDFKTADKLLEVAKNLKERYSSSLTALYAKSSTEKELEGNLMALAKGIGKVTAEIFLREMYGIWNVHPEHTPLAVKTAKRLNIRLGKKFDKKLDVALIRYAHETRKKVHKKERGLRLR
ncbi:MAG: hypothetical protein LVQ95_00110 [Candidatus Micrarchaeales archaeon]|nr:hypothetical protein [Candidatus Micrarchaeales archaeon]